MRGSTENFSILVPPHLESSDYAAFVMEVLARADPAKAARQKAIEERITVPFRLTRDEDGAGETRGSPLPANARAMKLELGVTTHARQKEGDRAYWRKQTEAVRLDMVETLRKEAGNFLYEYPARLRRVVAVARKA